MDKDELTVSLVSFVTTDLLDLVGESISFPAQCGGMRVRTGTSIILCVQYESLARGTFSG